VIRLKRTPLHLSVFVLALTAIALIATLLFRPLIEPNFFGLFFVVVVLSSWFYGSPGGMLGTALSAIVVLFFFLKPASSASSGRWNAVLQSTSFILLSALITWLASGWRASKGLLAATLSSIGDAVIATDAAARVTFLNPVAEGLTGWRQPDAKGKPLSSVLRIIDEKSREPAENPVEKAIRGGGVVGMGSHTVLISKDGAEIPVEDSASPIRDETGKLIGAILVFRDVTGRKQLEEQLSQSQKMEAIGRLAGGVAGDFNNLLTVITGYSELLRTELAGTNPLRKFAEEIMYAAERAAGLTRQLLAFSRGQAALVRMLDLNAVLTGMESMLGRLLGENIELIVLPGPKLGRIKADPVQIEQVIMNLATNSREAMPTGGKLVLETANVDLDESGAKKVGAKPGSYVMLAVSDTGVGMDAETRSRLFEPFFTTKEQGQGSGLGLSTVYGIVRQTDGYITVYSQLGCGTIFEIYIPRVTEAPETTPAKPVRLPKGSETILLVDDEDGVRKLVSSILHNNGYTVIEARNGQEALAAYEKNAHKIDLVVTDVVMPQMNGFELGQQLEKKNPELQILYISGFRDSGATGDGEPARPFLHKPFTPDVLLNKVRELLDTQAQQ
jgi:two-component system, cell cycle sensor histidine kinase and response regulator CckA